MFDNLPIKVDMKPLISRAMENGLEIYLIRAVKDYLCGQKKADVGKKPKRIIAYGALGKNAKKFAQLLKGTPIEPTEFWDINGGVGSVLKPAWDTITPDDTILIFPYSLSIIEEVEAKSRLKSAANT